MRAWKPCRRPACSTVRALFRSPPATAQPVARNFAGRATLAHPPGIYGPADGSLAVNALNPVRYPGRARPRGARRADPAGRQAGRAGYPAATAGAGAAAAGRRHAGDALARRPAGLGPPAPRGHPRRAPGRRWRWLRTLLPEHAARLAQPQPVPAAPADNRPPIPRELFAAGAVTRLAYVVTGDQSVDDMSKAGLAGLNMVLGARTALEPGDAVGINADRDELAFFPVLYWPIVAGRPIPSAETLRKLEAYMKGGGLVIFDTRDAMSARPGGGTTPEGDQLRRMLQTLDIPELEPLPRDHVLTKTFYILDEIRRPLRQRHDLGRDPAARRRGRPPPGPRRRQRLADRHHLERPRRRLGGGPARRGAGAALRLRPAPARDGAQGRRQPRHVRAHRQLQGRPGPRPGPARAAWQ